MEANLELGAIVWVAFVGFFLCVSLVGFALDARQLKREHREMIEKLEGK